MRGPAPPRPLGRSSRSARRKSRGPPCAPDPCPRNRRIREAPAPPRRPRRSRFSRLDAASRQHSAALRALSGDELKAVDGLELAEAALSRGDLRTVIERGDIALVVPEALL